MPDMRPEEEIKKLALRVKTAKQAIKNDSSSHASYNVLATSFYRLSQLKEDEEEINEVLHKALEYVNKALEISLNNLLYLAERAQILAGLNNFDDAIIDFKKVSSLVALDPNFGSEARHARIEKALQEFAKLDAIGDHIEELKKKVTYLRI